MTVRMTGRIRFDEPGLGVCVRRWWPCVAGTTAVTVSLVGAYLISGGGGPEPGAAAAEPGTGPPPEARRVADRAATGRAAPIGTYTTGFRPGEARVRNISLAARALDGRTVAAGARFSFNGAVGPRTARRGYVPAPTIVGARLVNDVGGGICQVSTTLFNAVFDAGLKIRRARAHTQWMPEYPQGREAAVAYPGLDFVWRNDSGHPVTIRTALTPTTLTVTLWGTRRYRVRSDISRPYRITRAGTAAPGRGARCVPMPGGRGFSIDVWRSLYEDGRRVRRERYHTVYQAQPKASCV
ncbi:VanW family protein [Actinomadura parmotrematis]|uniref:VanW family protein n=1 Tax=Actinomadura parmotrematis TaxID=2864039 RepID=A0ABS7FZB9_9ACTN|nr:VanW family protein [Actinomadura parmotrematis]MBW8485792.1 VanW family protein [Actinomadura parmotrematis]